MGAIAGTMQHLSIGQDPSRFFAASSLMGVRRALTSTEVSPSFISGRDQPNLAQQPSRTSPDSIIGILSPFVTMATFPAGVRSN
jgi:hypothetical protein